MAPPVALASTGPVTSLVMVELEMVYSPSVTLNRAVVNSVMFISTPSAPSAVISPEAISMPSASFSTKPSAVSW